MAREPLGREAFTAAFEELDPSERDRFVRRLWEARGWRVKGGDGRFSLVSDAGKRRVLLVNHPDRELDAADSSAEPVTVVPDDVDAAELRRRALYAVDGDARADLFEILGRDPLVESDESEERNHETSESRDEGPVAVVSDWETDTGEMHDGESDDGETDVGDVDSSTDETDSSPAAPGRKTAVVAVVVLCLVSGALVAGSLMAGSGPVDAGSVASDGSGTDETWTPPSVGATGGNYRAEFPASAGVGDSRYPPGIEAEGVVDSDALARAHEERLPTSYRLTVTYLEFRDGRPVARVVEVVSVESPSKYRVAVERDGRPTLEIGTPNALDTYANGSVRTERTGERTYRVNALDSMQGTGVERYRDQVAQYVEWYLSVESSTLVGTVERNGRTYYRVSYVGDPWPGSANVTGSALVRSDGVVCSLRRRWADPEDPSVRAVVVVEYVELGGVTVSPPDWFVNGSVEED